MVRESERTAEGFAMSAPLPLGLRHKWENDVCVRCGLARHGYAGGRTGQTVYFKPGSKLTRFKAGNCEHELKGER